MPEVYIRGNTIKYVRVPDEVVDKVKEEQLNRKGGRAGRRRDRARRRRRVEGGGLGALAGPWRGGTAGVAVGLPSARLVGLRL
jgi:U6 snRNA-associated Sm-like protein LSm4